MFVFVLVCSSQPCMNGGVCSAIGGIFSCLCSNGFYGLQCQFNKLNSTLFVGSTILSNELGIKLANLTNLPLTFSPFKLIYQASVDGFSASSFHSKCDGYQGTFIVMKSNYSNIFGGYTSADWSGYHQYKYDSSSFLFSLVNSYNVSVKMNILNLNYAIYASPSYGVYFGSGSDLYCYDNLNCYSYFSGSYQLPSFLRRFSQESEFFLGGNNRFSAVEIEVYSIYIDRK